eukprot:scaffold343193_cov35-Attheya_sp.AAC.2
MVDSVENSSGRPRFFRERDGIAQVGFSSTANAFHSISVQNFTGDIGEEHILLIWCNVSTRVDDGFFA